MRIIAFTGKKGSGKDTAAESLIHLGFVQLGFADPIRAICQTMFGLTHAEMAIPLLKERKLNRYPFCTPRECMQMVASLSRDIWPEVWVKHLEARLDSVANNFKDTAGIVITDLRHQNEEAMLRTKRAKIIRITRASVKDNEFSNHSTEQELDKIKPHWTLTNDGTQEQLQSNVLQLVSDNQLTKVRGLRK